MTLLRLALPFLLATTAASAAELRDTVVVGGPIVTIGDLFEGAGDLGSRPLFRAPDLGIVGQLPAGAAVNAARALGLHVEPTALQTVTVTRESIAVTGSEIDALVRAALADRIGAEAADLVVGYRSEPATLFADALAEEPVAIEALTHVAGTGRFELVLRVDQGAAPLRVTLAGEVQPTIEVVTLLRDLPRGSLIGPGDVTLTRVEARRVAGGAVTTLEAAVGQQARRGLRAGQTLSTGDAGAATLVGRGSTVTLSFTRPGLSLTAIGEALSDGALGETVSVLNRQSRRIVEGVVTAPGIVEVSTVPVRIASLEEPAQ